MNNAEKPTNECLSRVQNMFVGACQKRRSGLKITNKVISEILLRFADKKHDCRKVGSYLLHWIPIKNKKANFLVPMTIMRYAHCYTSYSMQNVSYTIILMKWKELLTTTHGGHDKLPVLKIEIEPTLKTS